MTTETKKPFYAPLDQSHPDLVAERYLRQLAPHQIPGQVESTMGSIREELARRAQAWGNLSREDVEDVVRTAAADPKLDYCFCDLSKEASDVEERKQFYGHTKEEFDRLSPVRKLGLANKHNLPKKKK